MKICTVCKEIKPLNEFYKSGRGIDGIESGCKVCSSKRKKKYHRTKDGLVTTIYGGQVNRSKNKEYPPPTYTKQELREWLYSQKKFHELYDNWKDSGYDTMLSPSCDRTDDYKGYSLDRLQIMTWQDNFDKGQNDRRNGINNKRSKAVISINIITGEQIEYYSMHQAWRETGIFNTSISACCLGKNKSAGGFYWEYVE